MSQWVSDHNSNINQTNSYISYSHVITISQENMTICYIDLSINENKPLLEWRLNVHGSRPCVRYHTVPVYSSPPYIPRDVLNEGRMFRTLCNSFQTQES